MFIFKKFFTNLVRAFNVARQIILNLLFVGFFLILIIHLFSNSSQVEMPQKGALVLNIHGRLVEQLHYESPFSLLSGQPSDKETETLLSDVIFAIERATYDDRITVLVLNLDRMQNSSLSKITAIGEALKRFKASGKKVIAYGDAYTQTQYLLASFADSIYLDPYGSVIINGLARYRTYFKSMLDKLKIQVNVFRVGQFKSAIEPFTRNRMSQPAKYANRGWLNELWGSYLKHIKDNRNLKDQQLILTETALIRALEQYQGNAALLAEKLRWIDERLDYTAFNKKMIELVGQNLHHEYQHIDFQDYLTYLNQHPYQTMGNIGLIVAEGEIFDGYQPPGSIGGDSTVQLLKQAEFNNQIKAVVLRIDSPGGSAFASEKIRRAVVDLQQAGKPVVVSMGSVAASGGYWMAMDADFIYATPTTLTGSIGVFGMVPTFDQSLREIGVNVDGIGTTPWAGYSVLRPLTPTLKKSIQLSVEHIYQEFIQNVARSRELKIRDVNIIAQGRIWSGMRAKKIGLVDELGDLNNAIYKAAELAKIDQLDTQLIDIQPSMEEVFLSMLIGQFRTYTSTPTTPANSLRQWLQTQTQPLQRLLQYNDPQHIYLLCENCQ